MRVGTTFPRCSATAVGSGRRSLRLPPPDLSTETSMCQVSQTVDMLHEPAVDEPLGDSVRRRAIARGMEYGGMEPARRVFVGSATPFSVQCDAVSAIHLDTYQPAVRLVFCALLQRTELNGKFGTVVHPLDAGDGRIAVRIDGTDECVRVLPTCVRPRSPRPLAYDVARVAQAQRFSKNRDEFAALMHSSYIENPHATARAAAVADILSTLQTGEVAPRPWRARGRLGGVRPHLTWSRPVKPPWRSFKGPVVHPSPAQDPVSPWINHLCEDQRPLGVDGEALGNHDGNKVCPLVLTPESQQASAAILELPSDSMIRGCLRCSLQMSVKEATPDPVSTSQASAHGTWSPADDLHMTVVDAGASVTAIRRSTLDAFTSRPDLRPLASNIKFRTAKSGGGSTLKCQGTATLCFYVGGRQMVTTAYVFEELAEPMLLGCNTIYEHSLVIDSANMAVYKGTPIDVLPVDAIPMYFQRPVCMAMVETSIHDTRRVELLASRRDGAVYFRSNDESTNTLYSVSADCRVPTLPRQPPHARYVDGLLHVSLVRYDPLRRTQQVVSLGVDQSHPALVVPGKAGTSALASFHGAFPDDLPLAVRRRLTSVLRACPSYSSQDEDDRTHSFFAVPVTASEVQWLKDNGRYVWDQSEATMAVASSYGADLGIQYLHSLSAVSDCDLQLLPLKGGVNFRKQAQTQVLHTLDQPVATPESLSALPVKSIVHLIPFIYSATGHQILCKSHQSTHEMVPQLWLMNCEADGHLDAGVMARDKLCHELCADWQGVDTAELGGRLTPSSIETVWQERDGVAVAISYAALPMSEREASRMIQMPLDQAGKLVTDRMHLRTLTELIANYEVHIGPDEVAALKKCCSRCIEDASTLHEYQVAFALPGTDEESTKLLSPVDRVWLPATVQGLLGVAEGVRQAAPEIVNVLSRARAIVDRVQYHKSEQSTEGRIVHRVVVAVSPSEASTLMCSPSGRTHLLRSCTACLRMLSGNDLLVWREVVQGVSIEGGPRVQYLREADARYDTAIRTEDGRWVDALHPIPSLGNKDRGLFRPRARVIFVVKGQDGVVRCGCAPKKNKAGHQFKALGFIEGELLPTDAHPRECALRVTQEQIGMPRALRRRIDLATRRLPSLTWYDDTLISTYCVPITEPEFDSLVLASTAELSRQYSPESYLQLSEWELREVHTIVSSWADGESTAEASDDGGSHEAYKLWTAIQAIQTTELDWNDPWRADADTLEDMYRLGKISLTNSDDANPPTKLATSSTILGRGTEDEAEDSLGRGDALPSEAVVAAAQAPVNIAVVGAFGDDEASDPLAPRLDGQIGLTAGDAEADGGDTPNREPTPADRPDRQFTTNDDPRAEQSRAAGQMHLDRIQAELDLGWETQREDGWQSSVVAAFNVQIPPRSAALVPAYVTRPIKGPNMSLEFVLGSEFKALYSECVPPVAEYVEYHPSISRLWPTRICNTSDRPVTISHKTVLGDCFLMKCEWAGDSGEPFSGTPDPLWYEPTVRYDESRTSISSFVLCELDGTVSGEEESQAPPEHVKESDHLPAISGAGFEGVHLEQYEYIASKPSYRSRSFEEGGPATDLSHLTGDTIALDLTQSHDLGAYHQPLLEGPALQPLVDACLSCELVWSRNAKAPALALHPLTRVSIPTGDHAPIRQKPYPIPFKYVEAVRKEIDGLLAAGLIEPGFSDWCSPVICIIKKDSTESEIRLKLATDLRRVNASTVIDSGLLGDQSDILDTFHGKPYVSLCDAAGGFYQFALNEEDGSAKKTCFVLPTSCGGTTFIWKVAPYGLTNMPATYSRAMMYFLRGLTDFDLGYEIDHDTGAVQQPAEDHYLGVGSAVPWVDDITIATGQASKARGVAGHCAMLEVVFRRLIAAGMTLKGSKAHLLRKFLEVLGFLITRDGIIPQPDKIKGIRAMPDRLKDQKEVLRFLGMVNFIRRFVYRLGVKAEPLYNMLKLDPKAPWAWDDAVQGKAVQEIKRAVAKVAMQSHPDLADPLAEYVLMTDASDVAAGAVLFQWQYDPSTAATQLTPEEAEELKHDAFSTLHRARVNGGYRLRLIGFYSKTFHKAQRNYAIFHKEAASIVLAMRHWHRLLAGRPVVVYTDNTVASSMISNKAASQPERLQRWGIELSAYLPHLRIAYRKGEHNEVADLASRPAEEALQAADRKADEVARAQLSAKYLEDAEEVLPTVDMPDDLFDKVASVDLGDSKFAFYERSVKEHLAEIWKAMDAETQPLTQRQTIRRANAFAKNEALQYLTEEDAHIQLRLNNVLAGDAGIYAGEDPSAETITALVRTSAFNSDFIAERRAAEDELNHWQQYVTAFRNTHGRTPVVYDLFCGEGLMSTGAVMAGCEVYGFDKNQRPYTYGYHAIGRLSNGHYDRIEIPEMRYQVCDINEQFWENLCASGRYQDLPPPDFVHASPPCAPYSPLRGLPNAKAQEPQQVTSTLRALARYAKARLEGVGGLPRMVVPWSVENVMNAHQDMLQEVDERQTRRFCGTMYGHKVFRHRVVAFSHPVEPALACSHQGKYVGGNAPCYDHGQRVPTREANMYAPYSRRSARHGSMDDLHDAMGFPAGSFTYRGLVQGIPSGYGIHITSLLASLSMYHNYGMPMFEYDEALGDTNKSMLLTHWSVYGYTAQRIHLFGTQGLIDSRREVLDHDLDLHDLCDRTSQAAGLNAFVTREMNKRVRQGVLALWLQRRFRVRQCAKTGVALAVQRWYRRKRSEKATEGSTRHRSRRIVEAIEPPDFSQADLTFSDWKSAFQVTREAQLLDPQLKVMIESLEATKAVRDCWTAERRRQAKVYRLKYQVAPCTGLLVKLTTQGVRTMVPYQYRYDLLKSLHCHLTVGSGHRGGDTLYNDVKRLYHWHGMYSDCAKFVSRCEVCMSRAPQANDALSYQVKMDPPFPFHTIAIDHKDLPESVDSPYRSLLVVVDELTRFVIAIPVETKTERETAAALFDHVFSTFAFPCVIRSDNNFRTGLQKELGKYIGARNIHSLPYSPWANGQAEQAVARVSKLLTRHCSLYQSWHKSVNSITFALNCAKHDSTGMSPYFAVFGRQPTTVPELENPENLTVTQSGSDFLRDRATHMREAWNTVRDHSYQIRSDQQRRAAQHAVHQESRQSEVAVKGISEGDFVYLRHGDAAFAKQRRKHGFPAHRRFLVTEVFPETQSLRIDTRGTGISPVVSARLVRRAQDCMWVFDDGSPASGVTPWAADIMPTTIQVHGNPLEAGGRLRDPATDVDVDPREALYVPQEVIQARRSKGHWQYLVKWQASDETSWIDADKVMQVDDELQASIDDARAQYHHRMKERAARSADSSHPLESRDEEYLDPATFVSAFDLPSVRRGPRDRDAAKQAQAAKAQERALRKHGLHQLLCEDPQNQQFWADWLFYDPLLQPLSLQSDVRQWLVGHGE